MYAKIFQKAAFRLESGKTGAGQASCWGSTNVNTTLGANRAIPYTSFGRTPTINTVKDNSIIGEGFEDAPRKTGSFVEQSIGFINKFDGINPLLFWGFGLEDEVLPVICYVLSTVSVDPSPGDTYTDGDAHVCTFLRKEVNKSATFYIFTQTVAPTATTGTLTRTAGAGDVTLSYTARSSLMYEHIFQLDPHERHLTAPRSEEQLADYDTGDLKCRMALMGVNMGPSIDILNYNAMCKKISVSSSAGEVSNIVTEFLAHSQAIGDYTSSSWTFPTTVNDSDSNIIHHLWQMQLGTAIGSMTTLGVTSFDLGIEVPLQVIQDTISGLYLAEPVMEGKYVISLDWVLSRYSATTWQDLRDAWTSVVARISATQGYYLQEFLINNAIIATAGPDEDSVSKEPLKIETGFLSTNNWATYMYGSTLTHSPIMLRVRNTTSTNMMLTA